ncbi:TonB-dependent siderophore receptor [Gallibacterium genomosp. 1]|uniref:TonB-dependent siderophore receptor n=1 Tax=Gallibacterium genomosp. 1 TaxID=155515 RepID=UPI0008028091|nr:TonB-dependent siderophore receptor [Gallibacterium genomosp. 1]OBX02743.1 ligand-gated channel protein [Gallibacterium genomosp. 1]
MKKKTIFFYILICLSSPHIVIADSDFSDNTLEQVEVITELERYKATNKLKSDVNLSLLGQQTAFATPISVINYNQQAIEQTEARNIVDAIAKMDASVMNFGGETNTLSGIYVRGLQLDARQFSVNGLTGLYSSYNSPLSAVASAQLIKGASTATVGMDPEGSSGASVNIQTKRATDTPINILGMAWYSKDRTQPYFDFGRRFGNNKQWGIRISGLYRDGDTARKHFNERNSEIAIGADYRGDKLRTAIDYMHTKRATKGGRARIQDIQDLDFVLAPAPDGEINLIPHWSGQTTEDQTIMATFEYDLPYHTMLSGGIGHMSSKYYGAFGQIRMATPQTYNIQSMRAMNYKINTTSANLKLHGDFNTHIISHNWNIAWDSVIRTRDFKQSPVIDYKKDKTFRNINLYNPVFPNSPTYKALVQSTNEKVQAHSIAFADTLGFFEDELRLTVGGRYQWIKQTDYQSDTKADNHRFSPMLTLAYQPTSNLIWYANYLEDLEPGAVDEDGVMSKPLVSKQIELGVRKNWGEQYTTTLSIYQLSRPGTITSKAANNYQRKAGEQQGKERNRGIEFNLYANLLNGYLRSNLGISYNKGELLDYANWAGQIIDGTQVASPRIIAKVGIEWDTPFIHGLTLNSAIQYYGSSYQDYTKKYKFPSYTTVDIGAKYAFKLQQQQFILKLGVENLFNKHYWQVQRGRYDRSFAVLGMPRTYWANIELSF